MHRTTIKALRSLVATLNDVTGNPRDAYRPGSTPMTMVAVPGVYILDCAYGGYRLAQMVNETGGEQDITPRYGASVTADLIRAYMAGFDHAKRQERIAA